MLVAAPLGVLAPGVQAADIASTIAEQEQFGTLAKVIEAAGLAKALEGDGPYTVFAPTDQAFERLPAGVQDALMSEENRDQIERLLQHHVVEGEEITASDLEGGQTEVSTMYGDRLTIDGTGAAIVLLPEGGGMETAIDEETGMPASPHQREVLAEEPATEMRQTAEPGAVPSSPHQEQVLRDEPQEEPQSGQQGGMEQPQTAQGMPTSPHQEQVLREEEQDEQQAGMAQPPTAQGMPASPHQEQVLRDEPQRGQSGGQGMRATVTEADIKADNGVIHAIDAVLIPQAVLSTLERSGSQQGQAGQTADEQG